MKILFIITILFIVSLNCKAQNKVAGTLPAWDKGNADIIMGMAELFSVGTVHGNGEFAIALTNDVLEKTKKSMEAYNSASSGGCLKLNTLKRVFRCYEEDVLTVTNGDQQAVTLATMGAIGIANLDQNEMHGNFMSANSRAFAEAFQSFGQKDAVKGFYLNWYLLEAPASVKGTCNTTTYALNQKDSYEQISTYDLKFKDGWNLVKISLVETYTDADGKTYGSSWTYRTINDMPEETQFIFFGEEH